MYRPTDYHSPAFHHIAEEDVDFLVHVGDFVYESDDGQFEGIGSRSYHDWVKELPGGADVGSVPERKRVTRESRGFFTPPRVVGVGR